MELLFIGGLIAFLVWRTLSAGQAMARPVPPEIPPERRAAFQVSWLGICLCVIIITVTLLVMVGGAGLAVLYEQQGKCDNSIRVPNPPFGDVGQCIKLVNPDR